MCGQHSKYVIHPDSRQSNYKNILLTWRIQIRIPDTHIDAHTHTDVERDTNTYADGNTGTDANTDT